LELAGWLAGWDGLGNWALCQQPGHHQSLVSWSIKPLSGRAQKKGHCIDFSLTEIKKGTQNEPRLQGEKEKAMTSLLSGNQLSCLAQLAEAAKQQDPVQLSQSSPIQPAGPCRRIGQP